MRAYLNHLAICFTLGLRLTPWLSYTWHDCDAKWREVNFSSKNKLFSHIICGTKTIKCEERLYSQVHINILFQYLTEKKVLKVFIIESSFVLLASERLACSIYDQSWIYTGENLISIKLSSPEYYACASSYLDYQ